MADPRITRSVSDVNGDARVVLTIDRELAHTSARAIAKNAPAVDGVRTLESGFALPAVEAPTETPDGMALIYLDEADGDLKVRFPNGTVKTLATDEP